MLAIVFGDTVTAPIVFALLKEGLYSVWVVYRHQRLVNHPVHKRHMAQLGPVVRLDINGNPKAA